MLFVAIGLIILFISFLIALVSLIREFSQMGGDEEISFDDYQGLEQVVEVVPSTVADEAIGKSEEVNLASSGKDLTGDEPVSLEETVPFPWEREDNFANSSQARFVGKEEANAFDLEPTFKVSRDNLYGEVSIQDLKQKN